MRTQHFIRQAFGQQTQNLDCESHHGQGHRQSTHTQHQLPMAGVVRMNTAVVKAAGDFITRKDFQREGLRADDGDIHLRKGTQHRQRRSRRDGSTVAAGGGGKHQQPWE